MSKIVVFFACIHLFLQFLQAQAITRPRVATQTVYIGLVDSGIDLANPDLRQYLLVNDGELPGNRKDDDGNGYIDDHIGYDFLTRMSSGADKYGHGTAMAWTILGNTSKNFGLPDETSNYLKIMPVTWIRPTYLGNDDNKAAAAVEYVLKRQKAVGGNWIINASWNIGSDNLLLRRQLSLAQQAGILVVVSTGNDYGHILNLPSSYSYSNFIRVGAADGDGLAAYSNLNFDLVAEGTDISFPSIDGQENSDSGTSFATAMVTRLAAYIWSRNPHWNYQQVKNVILKSADSCPETFRKYQGKKLNPEKTLKLIASK